MLKHWKIWIPSGLVLGLLIWWVAAGLSKQVLIRADGQLLVADQIWIVEQKVFFIRGVEMAWLPRTPGDKILKGSFTNSAAYAPLLATHFRTSLKKHTGLSLPEASFSELLRGARAKIGHYASQIIGYLFLILGIALFFLIKHGRRFFKSGSRSATDRRASADSYHPPLAGIADVEALFLELFREKIGAPAGAPVQVVPLTKHVPGGKRVVELKIKHEGAWRARRMTIAPIGENTGSRSQCFYVIFDTHMVVKIPPKPINNFDEYTALVRAEARIKRKLAPRVCVIPNFSVILTKTRIYHGAGSLAADNLEEEYIRWLKLSENYQRFLKVGGSFVFFMDLARYYFLGHVTESFHRADKVFEKEISSDAGLLTDSGQFEAKYGASGRELWPDINRLYENFKSELTAKVNEKDYLSDWHIQSWFLANLAGLVPQNTAVKMSRRLDEDLTDRLQSFGQERTEIGHRYRQLLGYHTRDRLFSRNRPMMGAMATNLLELLEWLEKNRVAMRDLKPDNLLVAGDPSSYPHFLKSAKSYTIGLIDLETAVDYGSGSALTMSQPQLGGTPLYGTPSHFLSNKLLQSFHKDLAQIFVLQDWHAVIAIVFEVITGEKLFPRTAREIRNLIGKMMRAAAGKDDLKSAYAQFALEFWRLAELEFNDRVPAAAGQLEAVEVVLPELIQKRLQKYLAEEQSDVERRIAQCLDSTGAFSREKNRRLLLHSTVEGLERLHARYEGRKNSDILTGRIKDLIGLKQAQESLVKQLNKIAPARPRIAVRSLLELMFAVVQTRMYPENAETVPLKISPLAPSADDPASTPAETVLAEETAQGLSYSVTVVVE